MRDDSVKPSLKTPYDGPFMVLEKYDKYFKIQYKSYAKMISIDRLKPAFILRLIQDDPENCDQKSSNNIPQEFPEDKIQHNSSTHLENESPANENRNVKTRSGRHVTFPARYRL